MKRTRALAILCLLSLVLAMVANVFAEGPPLDLIRSGEIADTLLNMLLPASLAFFIPLLVYAALAFYAGAAVREAFRKKDDRPIRWDAADGTLIVTNLLFHAAWVLSLRLRLLPVSFALILILFGTLLIMEERNFRRAEQAFHGNRSRIRRGRRGERLARFAIPIELYLGWITVAAVASATVLLASFGAANLFLGEMSWTIVTIAATAVLALLMIANRGSITFALVVAGSNCGIALERYRASTPAAFTVAVAAAGAAGLILIVVAVRLLVTLFSRVRER